MTRMHTVRAFVLSVMVLALAGGWCFAQDGEIKLRGVKSSWKVYSKSGTWGIQWINVSNGSDSPVSVKAGTITEDSTLGKIEYTRQANIPAGMRRAVRVVYRTGELKARKNELGRKSGKAAKYVTAEWGTILRDADSDENLGRDVSQINVLPEKSIVFGFIRDTSLRHGTDSFIKSLSMGAGAGGIVTASTRPEDLPDAWYGYSMIDVMVVAGFNPERLMTSQTESLLQWVRKGGILLINGSDELPKFLAGPIGLAAGVTANDTLWVDKFTVTGGKAPAKLKFVWPVPMTELQPAGAEVLLHAEGLPLLTRRQLGDGWIFVLSTSLTAAKPTKDFDIWKYVKDARQHESAINADAFIAPVKAKPVYRAVKKSKRKKGNKNKKAPVRVAKKSQAPQLSPAEAALNSIAGRRGVFDSA